MQSFNYSGYVEIDVRGYDKADRRRGYKGRDLKYANGTERDIFSIYASAGK